MIATSSSLDDN